MFPDSKFCALGLGHLKRVRISALLQECRFITPIDKLGSRRQELNLQPRSFRKVITSDKDWRLDLLHHQHFISRCCHVAKEFQGSLRHLQMVL